MCPLCQFKRVEVCGRKRAMAALLAHRTVHDVGAQRRRNNPTSQAVVGGSFGAFRPLGP